MLQAAKHHPHHFELHPSDGFGRYGRYRGARSSPARGATIALVRVGREEGADALESRSRRKTR